MEQDLSGDTSADYGFDGSDSFSLGSENVSTTGPSGGSGGSDNNFFGGDSVNVMDFGRGPVSNITNAANYDPNFAALGMIGRGLTPGFDLRNQISFNVPSQMLPQIEGKYGPIGAKYYSPVERFMQEDLADFVQSGPGIMGLVGRGLDSLFGGIDFLNKSKAGSTIEEEIAKEEARVEIADLEEQRQNQLTNPSFTPMSTTVDKVELDPAFMDVDRTKSKDAGASLAVDPNLSPDFVSRMRAIDALPTYSAAKSRGIFDLPQAADLQNNQIAAGNKTGQTLNPEMPVSFPYGRSGGYNMSVLSSRGDAAKPNPIQGPPNPFVNDIVSPISRPFATTDEVALQRGTDGYYFANASNRKLDIPERISNFTFPTLTEAQVRASDDAGYSFEPTTNLATLGLQRDNTEFIEKANLPPELQGIVGLNTDLDYGQTTPLSVLLENTPLAVTARDRALKKEQEKKDKEIAEAEAFRKFRASLSPFTRIGGGYGGVNEPVRPNYSSGFTPSLPPLY